MNHNVFDKRIKNPRRPKKLTKHDERNIIRPVHCLRIFIGSFTAKRLRTEADILATISVWTNPIVLNRHGYRYLQSRKKGMLTSKDAYKRLKFARQMKRLSPYFWKRYVRFYFDGTSFVDKTNPYDQARTVKLRAWRRRNECLAQHCTSKGKKAEVKGKVVHFYFLAIAYKKGVICCDKYTKRLNGEFYESYIRKSFPKHFQASANPKAMHFLHDGDLSQNSAVAQKAMSDVDALLLRISARSPDFNPIVRIFSSSCQRCSIKKRCS